MQFRNGQLIIKFDDPTNGNAAQGVKVTITGESGGLATLYQNNDTSGPTLPNPLTSDSNGRYSYYAINGTYTESFSSNDDDATVTLVDNLSGYVSYEFNTVSDAQSGVTIGGEIVTLKENDVIRIKERDSQLFDVISGTGSANGLNIIAHTTLNISFEIRYDRTETSAVALGLVGDDSKDNKTSIDIIDGLGGCVFKTGTYQIHSNTTLDGQYTFVGGILKPLDGTVTITMSKKPFITDQIQCFDISNGGLFKIASVHNFDLIESIWFGMTPDDTSEAQAKQNMRAIALALNMANLGATPLGIGVTPPVYLPIGTFTIDDWESSGVGANVKSYQTLLGRKDSSYLNVRIGAPAMDIFLVNEVAANSVIFDDFQIDGNFASQTSAQNGIVINTPAGAVIYSQIGSGMYIKEMSGWGIRVEGAGMDNSEIAPFLVRDCTLGNLYIDAADLLVVKGKYRSAKGNSPGISITGTNVRAVDLVDVSSEENGGDGLVVTNINSEAGVVNVSGGSYTRNGIGITFSNAYYSGVNGAKIERNGAEGVVLFETTGTRVTNNLIQGNRERGIEGQNSVDCKITDNVFDRNSDTNVNTFDDITLFNCDQFMIQLNKHMNSLSTTRYNVAIDDAASTNNLVTNNDWIGAGNTGTLSDAGTGTVTVAGNRV